MNICKPPDPLCLSGNNAKNWREFKEQLQWFLAGTESGEKSDAVKIGIMLSHAGKEAREVYKTLTWAADGDKDKFDKVLEAFEQFCAPQKNILYERHGFWSLHQEEGEAIDAYVTRLKLKIDSCEYDKTGWPPAVKLELTRDKFIFGLLDDALKERLLREVDLSLQRAVSLAQRSESSKTQAKAMSIQSITTFQCDEVKQWSQKGGTLIACGQCGRRHRPKECPAFGQHCAVCNKLNHFAKVCRNKRFLKPRVPNSTKRNVFTVDDQNSGTLVSESQEEGENLLVDPLKIDGMVQHIAWMSKLLTPNGDITCKLDTGAEANVLPATAFNKLTVRPPLHPTTTRLTAYGGSLINPIGMCDLQCDINDNSHKVKFYVVDVDSQPILGLQDCERLGLIKRMDVVHTGQLTKESVKTLYQNVFTGLGKLGKYHITLQDGCTPVVHPPRRIPHSLKDRLHKAIEANVKSGVLVKVEKPTDWVHNLVIVEKKNGTLRLCLDPKTLNDVIKREHYRIPTIQEITSNLAGKKVFSTLDLKNGYWQVELDEESSLLCTFNTPFGRYRFTRMPFGLKSASEIFQKKNEAVFEGIEGIHIVADDIIIAANDLEEHNAILHKVLQRASACNVKFNFDKFQFCVNEVKYLGTIISQEGMKPDPAKVLAIKEMPTPEDKAAVRRLLGMINYLAPHIPNMASICKPLRDLTKADVHFQWNMQAQSAIEQVKSILSSELVLRFFDPTIASVVQADASQHGLGACLLQHGKPVAYASRSLSNCECNYAQIEKELLAIVFACGKFHHFIYGFPTSVQTDHKPLEIIFKKPLHQVSPRLQRMLLRLQKYDLTIRYVKGKHLYIADTLSRAHSVESDEDIDSEEIHLAVHSLLQDLPITEERLKDIQQATKADSRLQRLKQLIEQGWPQNINNVPQDLHGFWRVRENLCIAEDLILMGSRLTIPPSRQAKVLQSIHEGHLGIEKCKSRARMCVYWPNINDSIEQLVKNCSVCNKYGRANQKEPLQQHPVPSRPWEKIGTDYFTIGTQDYLLVVDYFSKYPEVIAVKSKSADATVQVMKTIFARHGIPTLVIADNMPFNSKLFKQFANDWNFSIITSSPLFPQSNGFAERYVQTIKSLLKKAKEAGSDEHLALLEFRNTPVSGLNESPAQLLMSRHLRSSLPMIPSTLVPATTSQVKDKLVDRQVHQKHYYDKNSKPLPPLKPNDPVRYRNGSIWKPAVVMATHAAPRSYIIQTSDGTILRRNRRHLKRTAEKMAVTAYYDDDDDNEEVQENNVNTQNPEPDDVPTPDVTERRSRYGRLIKRPIRYQGN